MFEKIVVVTRRTRLEELIERFNTRGQAKFYLEHAGGDFSEYEQEHDTYARALDRLRRDLDLGLPRQFLDRALVPTYSFDVGDVVVTLGQDGLVANTAKYAGAQPIVGVNPDPARFDGILLPFSPGEARVAVQQLSRVRSRPARSTSPRSSWVMGSGSWLSTISSSVPGPMSRPATVSASGRSAKPSRRAACWCPPAPAPPAGCRASSTWRAV